LCKKFNSQKTPQCIVIPNSLVPYVLALFHYQTHSGVKKLLATIRLKYYWKTMEQDVRNFCRGCIICNISKTSLQGKSEIGTPRVVLEPFSAWQIDICSGLISVNGAKAFLNIIDLYSGFCIPVIIKNETSKEVAKIIDDYIIKIFFP